jgi:hypothetical protein
VKKYLRRSLGLALCAALAVCAAAAPAPGRSREESRADTRAEAERLWELAVAAKGGRERLHTVHSFLISAGSRKHPLIDLYAFPGRYWRWDASPEPLGLAVQMMNAERGDAYLTYPDDPKSPRKLGEVFLRSCQFFVTEAQLYFLLETRWHRPVPVEAREGEAQGRRADVVRVVVGDRRADYFLDRKTHLPLKVVYPARDDSRRHFEAKDYVDVGGLMLPAKVSYGGGFSPYAYVVNPDYDAAVFERPPTVEAGRDAWRPRAGR